MSGHYNPSAKRAAVTTSRTGGQASTFTLLVVAAAVGGWFYWRKRAAQQAPKEGGRQKAGRSRFRFPGSNSSSRSTPANASRSAFKLPQTVTAPAAKAGGARKGNPKKQNKKQRRAEKQAKQEAKGKGMELIHNDGIQSKEGEGPMTVKYVDLTKTAEVYDRVREYQDTGKKRF